jgi:hypothetical protein
MPAEVLRDKPWITWNPYCVAVGTSVYPAPPAQIRTCRISACGSYRRCLASKRKFGYG